MSPLRMLLLVAVSAALASPSLAQVLLVSPPPSFAYGGLSYSRHRSGSGLKLGFGFGRSSYLVAPSGNVSRVELIQVYQPPVIVTRRPPARVIEEDDSPVELPIIPVPRIRRDESKEKAPPAVPPVAEKAPVPHVPPDPPLRVNPVQQSKQLVRLGRESFELEEYGRAGLRFRAAIRLTPDEPLPHFLLAQTLLALGKYHECRDAILEGMEKDPDWPKARFLPIDLYGENVAEYPEHLLRLETTLKKHPGDPVLLLLNAYQGYFAGRKDASAPLFREALARMKGRVGTEAAQKTCERFLRELDAGKD